MTRKQKKAHNRQLRHAAYQRKQADKKAGINQRIPKDLSGPERQVYIDSILKTKETKTETQKATSWQQVLKTGDKETVYKDAQGKPIAYKITSKINPKKTDYRTLKNS